MYRRVLYYTDIYIVSPLVEGGSILGVSAGCQPPFLQGVVVVRLSMVGLLGQPSTASRQQHPEEREVDMFRPYCLAIFRELTPFFLNIQQ